jgi:hypothetical protein
MVLRSILMQGNIITTFTNINVLKHQQMNLHPKQLKRLEECRIVRNSYLNGIWGDEEVEGEFFLVPGRIFGIQMLTSTDGFTVLISGKLELNLLLDYQRYFILFNFKGKHFCNFKHRVSVMEVEAIDVKGDILIEDIVFTN